MNRSAFIALAGFVIGLGITVSLSVLVPPEGPAPEAAPRPAEVVTALPPLPERRPPRPERLSTVVAKAPAAAVAEKPIAPPPPPPAPAIAEQAPAGPPMLTEEETRREQIEHENLLLAIRLSGAAAAWSDTAPSPSPSAGTAPTVAPPSPSPSTAPAVLPTAPPPYTAPKATWQRFAALAPPTGGRPMVAVVLDDLGLSQFRSDRAVALPRPITMAILPYGRNLDGVVARARAAGHEILLHLPMEPSSGDRDPGPNALLTGLPQAELDRRIAANLGRLDGY
ncbi:MAG: divergent polysaccharide deacetylase family protein, partial [Alphaproteobacteria bacterium]|nr:divergent polysaccharide deacetylase family protein [Alphaproteobacteria bacterium]